MVDAAQYYSLQQTAFKGLKITAKESTEGSYAIRFTVAEWKIFQTNLGRYGNTSEVSGGPGAAGAMKLNVKMDSTGVYILILTYVQWELLQQSGSFEGIDVDATEGKDGSWTITMTHGEWNMFQRNQSSDGQEADKVSKKKMKLAVTIDASTLNPLYFNYNSIS